MMTTNDKKRLRNHANRNITLILDKLGVQYTNKGRVIQAACPCRQHGGDGDNTTAFSWRTDIGYWMCWTHHCQDTLGNDIFGLIRSVLDLSFVDAVDWIESVLSGADVDVTAEVKNVGATYSEPTMHVHEPLDENSLKWLKPEPEYMLNRGYSSKVLNEYNVGLWQRRGTYMDDRIVIPVRDHDDYLVGFTGRTIHDKEWYEDRGLQYRKWLHGRHYHRFSKDESLFTGSILFNLFKAKNYIKPRKRLILLEGPLDGLKLEMAGIHNWVASLSTSFGPVHRSLLVKYGINDLYVAYDNDSRKQPDRPTGSEKAWIRINKLVGNLFNLHKIELPLDRDPGDMSIEEIEEIFGPVSHA